MQRYSIREAKEFAAANPLLDYQRYAVNWELERLFTRDFMGTGLFLDPGLGKTRTTLTVLDTLIRMNEIKRALVVAPLRPMYNVWPNEIKKWGFDMSGIVLHGQHRTAMAENCQVEFVNPEGLVHLQDVKNRWDLIIVDESTKFKTWGTKTRMKPLRKMLKTIPKRTILTGTPAANSLGDLHAQLFILDDGEALGRNVTYFRTHYMTTGGYQGRQWIIRPDMEQDLLSRIEDKVLRMKAEDFLDMPKLVIRDVWCDLSPELMRQYKKLKKELYIQLQTGDIYAGSASAAYTKCKQFANGSVYNQEADGSRTSHKAHDEKINALIDLVDELAGKPLLVAYSFKQDLEALKKRKQFKNAPHIAGGAKEKDVAEIVRKWNKGEIRVLLCQNQSVSHGMNMQEACNDVAWFGLTDSPETYDQFFRRVYRLGVKGDQVRIHRLLTRGTVDEVMLDRLNGKFATQAQFLAGLKKHSMS